MDPGAALGLDAVVLQILGKAQQNAYAQLIIQETALQIPGSSALGSGVKADDIPHLNAQCLGIGSRRNILIQHDLHRIPAALGIAIAAVDMDGGVAKLAGTLDHPAITGVNTDILRFRILGPHAAQSSQL